MIHVRLDGAALFLGRGVARGVTGVRAGRVVVVVGPLGEVVCEFETREVGGRVLEVDYHELFVFVCGLEEGGGLVVWEDAEDVAVLGLRGGVSYTWRGGVERRGRGRTSPWAKTSLSRMVLAPP